jgi:hypothetical protein
VGRQYSQLRPGPPRAAEAVEGAARAPSTCVTSAYFTRTDVEATLVRVRAFVAST